MPTEQSLHSVLEEKKGNFVKFLKSIHLPDGKHRLLDDYIRELDNANLELFTYYVNERVVKFHRENCIRNLELYTEEKLKELKLKKEDFDQSDFDRMVKYLELFIFLLN